MDISCGISNCRCCDADKSVGGSDPYAGLYRALRDGLSGFSEDESDDESFYDEADVGSFGNSVHGDVYNISIGSVVVVPVEEPEREVGVPHRFESLFEQNEAVSVGDIVLFTPALQSQKEIALMSGPGYQEYGQNWPLPAVVVSVHSYDCANLRVLTDGWQGTKWETSVPRLDENNAEYGFYWEPKI